MRIFSAQVHPNPKTHSQLMATHLLLTSAANTPTFIRPPGKSLWSNGTSIPANPLTPLTDSMPASNGSSNLLLQNENSTTCSSWFDEQMLDTEDDEMVDEEDSLLSSSAQY